MIEGRPRESLVLYENPMEVSRPNHPSITDFNRFVCISGLGRHGPTQPDAQNFRFR